MGYWFESSKMSYISFLVSISALIPTKNEHTFQYPTGSNIPWWYRWNATFLQEYALRHHAISEVLSLRQIISLSFYVIFPCQLYENETRLMWVTRIKRCIGALLSVLNRFLNKRMHRELKSNGSSCRRNQWIHRISSRRIMTNAGCDPDD